MRNRLLPLSLLLGLVACSEPAPDASTSDAPVQGRTLVAVSNMTHPPFSSLDESGRAVGMEVDIVEAAAASLGYTVEWVERPFGELLTAVQSGEADFAVSTIGITATRRELVAFSEPYFVTQIVALVKDGPGRLESLVELGSKTIGADGGTTSSPAAKGQWPDATFVDGVADGMTWAQMVEAGVIDAFVVDASDQERLQGVDGVQLYRVPEPISEERFGVVVGLGAVELLGAVNRAIEVGH